MDNLPEGVTTSTYNHFHTRCPRKQLKVKWQDRTPDTEVMKKAEMTSIKSLLKQEQLRQNGHVTIMPDDQMSKKVYDKARGNRKRSQKGQKLRYKDTLKASLREFNTPIDCWERVIQERST